MEDEKIFECRMDVRDQVSNLIDKIDSINSIDDKKDAIKYAITMLRNLKKEIK